MESFIHGVQAFRIRVFVLPKFTALKQREVCHVPIFMWPKMENQNQTLMQDTKRNVTTSFHCSQWRFISFKRQVQDSNANLELLLMV